MNHLVRSPLALVAVALLAALVGAGAVLLWRPSSSVPQVEQQRIETVVRGYLLEHPEILPEAMQRLQDRETGQQVAANRDAIMKPFGSAWSGNPRGDVTVVEYYDYNCGYCRASIPVIDRLIAADPKVRIVYRELPVLSDESRVAARLSLAAAEQGKFAAFHSALFSGGRVSKASMAAAVARAGVDTGKAATNVARYEAEITDNLRVATGLGVTGTPSWVIGDRVLTGAQPLDVLRDAVTAARKQ